jgi:FkbM family methyltransferase
MNPAKRSPFLVNASAFVNFALTGRLPSKRALATLAKLQGHRLERRWPFLPKAESEGLNLGFEDILEFQYARRRSFFAMVVGAYDGVENDPVSNFIQGHPCAGILIEPQPGAFDRLRQNFGSFPRLRLMNAAIDRRTGEREFFQVPAGIAGLPQWTEQLASFKREHLEKHEHRAPGLSRHITTIMVPTISFDDLIDRFRVRHIDVLQIDAEGLDAQLLSWFPFDRIKPAVVHYEIAHMSAAELEQTRNKLSSNGYSLHCCESPTDEVAICV